MSERMLLPEEWAEIYGIEILDPDGWDRKNFKQDWARPLTEGAFSTKMMQSTIRQVRA